MEIEDPFGDDLNDLPLADVAARLVLWGPSRACGDGTLVCLWGPSCACACARVCVAVAIHRLGTVLADVEPNPARAPVWQARVPYGTGSIWALRQSKPGLTQTLF